MTKGNYKDERATRIKKVQAPAGQGASPDLEKQLSQQLEQMSTPVGYQRPEWYGKSGVYWLDNTTKENASFHRKFPIAHRANEQSQCVFRKDVLRNILDFSKSEAVPPVTPGTVEIKESKTGGLGVFACRDIKYGELLLAERPLVVYPIALSFDCKRLWDEMSKVPNGGQLQVFKAMERLQCIYAYETEMGIQKAFSEMIPDNQRAYLSLANSHQEDGSGPLSGILRTNGFEINLPTLEDDADGATKYTAIGKGASRFNHSCCPNAAFGFSLKSFSIQFHALKDIEKGEEVFCSYIGLEQFATERQEKLSPYGFKCICRACKSATRASDAFRKVSGEAVIKFCNAATSNTDSNRWANILALGLQFQMRMQAEGLDVMDGPYYILQKTIAHLYALLGNLDGQRKYYDVCEIWEERSELFSLTKK